MNSGVNLEYRYSPTQNNRQATQMKNWIMGEEVKYSYDSLNRLSTASTTVPQWGLSWTYDGFGNRSGTAMASLNGPDVWLSPFMLTAGQWARNAWVLAHETVHTLNTTDSEIQTAIWGAGSPEVGAASDNISRRFQKDCFSGYGGPG